MDHRIAESHKCSVIVVGSIQTVGIKCDPVFRRARAENIGATPILRPVNGHSSIAVLKSGQRLQSGETAPIQREACIFNKSKAGIYDNLS